MHIYAYSNSPAANIIDGVSLHDILQLPRPQLSADAHDYTRHSSSKDIGYSNENKAMLPDCSRNFSFILVRGILTRHEEKEQ